ncbi:MAG: hypothetical protein H0V82_03585 [Candidatus Protochlamydia sp.]|nr:hypothetical protein [Candidatus Protochlamydia sp.]
MYLNELEGRKNNELAWSYYSNAANKGSAEAWLRLGLMLKQRPYPIRKHEW